MNDVFDDVRERISNLTKVKGNADTEVYLIDLLNHFSDAMEQLDLNDDDVKLMRTLSTIKDHYDKNGLKGLENFIWAGLWKHRL